jgi:hypothetical protein
VGKSAAAGAAPESVHWHAQAIRAAPTGCPQGCIPGKSLLQRLGPVFSTAVLPLYQLAVLVLKEKETNATRQSRS